MDTSCGSEILPASYDMATIENGLSTHVAMAMRQGAVTSRRGAARTGRRPPTASRSPPSHKTKVVDPLSRLPGASRPAGHPSGRRACNRTVKVFDGWTRYDVQLSYKETKAIDGGANTYSGRIIVCAARYVPVAGHRPTRKAVQDMADNKRLEVWLAPVANMPVLVPFRILIGTELGDLIIYATRFTTDSPERHAMAD